MSYKRGKGKDKDRDDFICDDDAPPKKMHKKDTSGDDSGDDDTIFICEVSKNRRVSVRNWQGRVFVDIREFYVKDGKQMPGKKGLHFTTFHLFTEILIFHDVII